MDSGSKSEHNIISCKLQQDDDDEQGRILNYALVVNNDDCGVTSFGDATINKIHRVVCPNHFVAVLLHTQFAFFAAQTGANHASHSHLLPHFELGLWHLGTGLHHYPHYIKPRNQGVLGISPFVADLVQIRMANATKQDLDLHIFRTSCPRAHIIPPAKLSRSELRFSSKSLESPGRHGNQSMQWLQNKGTTAQFPCTWIQSGFQSKCKDVFVCMYPLFSSICCIHV
jgi:hypothetical protein